MDKFPGHSKDGRAPHEVWIDNGTEFQAEMGDHFKENGIQVLNSVEGERTTNAVEERFHPVLGGSIKASMRYAHGPHRFWDYCFDHMIFNIARTKGTNPIDPFSRRHGVPSKAVLVPWACKAVFKNKAAEKFQPSGEKGIVLRYGQMGTYEVMDLSFYV